MNKIITAVLFFCSLFFTACNTATPEKYFDVAVLNSNMLAGFAGEGMQRQLESPSAAMDVNGKVAAQKRMEVVDFKIKFIDDDFQKLKDLKTTDDAKDILQSATALYELVLPVYKTEYAQLAALYDKGAAKDELEAQAKTIHDKYFSRYETLYNKLIADGKLYAAKHNIKVNWGIY